MTREKLLGMLKKICKEHFKFTYMFVIGFVMVDDEHVYLAKKERQNGKKILLMKAGGKMHEYFKTIEREEDITFERVNEETRKKIRYVIFTDEDGNMMELPLELKPIPYEKDPKYLYFMNPIIYGKEDKKEPADSGERLY